MKMTLKKKDLNYTIFFKAKQQALYVARAKKYFPLLLSQIVETFENRYLRYIEKKIKEK